MYVRNVCYVCMYVTHACDVMICLYFNVRMCVMVCMYVGYV